MISLISCVTSNLTLLLSPFRSAARLDFIVEPWFMSEAGKSSPGGAEFADFKKTLEATKGVKFFQHVEDVPPVENGVKRLAIISARE